MAPTPSQTVGPFFGFAMPFEGGSDTVRPGSPGAIRIEGQVFDGAGQPVPDALLEVFEGEQFARCRTDEEGAFHFTMAKPATSHLNVFLFARGLLRHLATRLYFPGAEPDEVLSAVEPGRRNTLVAHETSAGLHFDLHLQGPEETVFFAL